jgi:phosphoglycerol transferase MdoB-like AlkP superfamily enzyme
MIRTLKIFASLFSIFLLHRMTSWSDLSATYGSGVSNVWETALTGILSDLWMASLLSLPFWPLEFTRDPRARFIQKNFAALWVFIWGASAATHQAYVEFFKFQIIPFHLNYLTDRSFLLSSSNGMIDAATGCLLVAAIIASFWVRSTSKFRKKRNTLITFISFVAISLLAHAANIRWRVNWFVIEPLQANYLESLYSNLRKKPTIAALTDQESQFLSTLTNSSSTLFLQSSPPQDSQLQKLALEVEQLKKLRRPILLAVIVSESLRDADIGPRASDRKSITPMLDRLSNSGVRFRNVYSSGPVTRGGQEAIWCGTPSATDTSLMRSFPDTSVQCLPAILKGKPGISTAWIHGGDELFDSQAAFWKKQGVDYLVTKGDFASDVPRTGWGISDLALFDRASTVISDHLKNDPKSEAAPVFVPMILSVSNHIPWLLPDDASIELKSANYSHQQFKTIQYFDESLEMFVGNLKRNGLWENSLIIITGDHGNLEPTWRQPYENDPLKWERMLSHIGVIMTGGITERLRSQGYIAQENNTYASQAQIMPLITFLALPRSESFNRLMNRALFEPSPWPTVSDLNQYLFLPEQNLRLPKEEVLSGQLHSNSTETRIASLRYRAWLEFLYNKKSAQN